MPRVQPIPVALQGAEPSVRELALAAQRYAKATQQDGGDFEAVYNHGLALQELATHVSDRSEQLRLLSQASGRRDRPQMTIATFP